MCACRWAAFGTKPRARAIERMREASSGRTVLVPMRPLRTFETSERETPASAAMSMILMEDTVVLWSCGRVVEWSCGRVVLWSGGLVVLWSGSGTGGGAEILEEACNHPSDLDGLALAFVERSVRNVSKVERHVELAADFADGAVRD